MTDANVSQGVTRRTALRGAAAAGGTVLVGTGADRFGVDPIDEADAAICGGVCIATGAVVGAGMVGYALGRASAPSPDRSAEQQEADWYNWVDFYTRADDMQTHDTTQLEQARRDINGMANLASRDAVMTIFEEAQDGASREETKNAAEATINDAFAQTRKGILNHWTSRMTEWEGDARIMLGDTYQTTLDTTLEVFDEVDEEWMAQFVFPHYDEHQLYVMPQNDNYPTYSRDLPNGDTIDVLGNEGQTGGGSVSGGADNQIRLTPWGAEGDPATNLIRKIRVQEPDPSEYEAIDESEVDTSDFDGDQVYLDAVKFGEVLAECETVRSGTIATVPTLLDAHFEAAQSGDVSLAEMMGSQGLLEAVETADSFREIAMAFRSMGWAIADTATVVEFDGEDGETAQVDSHLAFAAEEQPDPLEVGKTYDASELPGTLYIAYNSVNESGDVDPTYSSIVGEFTIATAEDESSDVAFEHRGVVDTSMDTQEIIDELRESNDARNDAEVARQDINVDSGVDLGLGGLFGGVGSALGGIPGWAWIGGGITGGYALLKSQSGDDGRAR